MTRQRRALNYAVEVLEQKYKLLAMLGPATDMPEEAEQKRDALEFAAERLSRPIFLVSPFV